MLFSILSPTLDAQSNNSEQQLRQRIVWSGGENALHYAVEVEKLEGNIYREFMREYTTTLFLLVSLQPGEYRFRVIPYDILGRPAESSRWAQFTINSNNNDVDTYVISSVNQNITGATRAEAIAAAEVERATAAQAEANHPTS